MVYWSLTGCENSGACLLCLVISPFLQVNFTPRVNGLIQPVFEKAMIPNTMTVQQRTSMLPRSKNPLTESRAWWHMPSMPAFNPIPFGSKNAGSGLTVSSSS